MAIRTICTAMIIVSLSSAAAAAQTDAFDACSKDQDPTARVNCFDRAVAARRTTQAPAAAATAPATPAPVVRTVAPPAPATIAATPAPAPAPTADRDVGLEGKQLRKQQEARGEPPKPVPAAITARVVRVIPREPLISVFELDNGQIWEQAEAMNISAEPQQQVTIRHGILGAFFLKTAAGAVVRVHRLQ